MAHVDIFGDVHGDYTYTRRFLSAVHEKKPSVVFLEMLPCGDFHPATYESQLHYFGAYYKTLIKELCGVSRVVGLELPRHRPYTGKHARFKNAVYRVIGGIERDWANTITAMGEAHAMVFVGNLHVQPLKEIMSVHDV